MNNLVPLNPSSRGSNAFSEENRPTWVPFKPSSPGLYTNLVGPPSASWLPTEVSVATQHTEKAEAASRKRRAHRRAMVGYS